MSFSGVARFNSPDTAWSANNSAVLSVTPIRTVDYFRIQRLLHPDGNHAEPGTLHPSLNTPPLLMTLP